MNKYKTIGIIGGQGPSSTADFYMGIVKYYQDTFAATYVRDFPPMIIYSVPTPDLVESIEDEKTTFSMISDAIKKLENDGADFIIIACNSLQYLNEKLQSQVKIPIYGIASSVARYLKNKKFKTIGILATETTIIKGVYDQQTKDVGVTLVRPNNLDQQTLSQVILHEFAGKTSSVDTLNLKRIIVNLKNKGAKAILLACTEFPFVIKQADVDIPLIDANKLYIEEAARLSSQI